MGDLRGGNDPKVGVWFWPVAPPKVAVEPKFKDHLNSRPTGGSFPPPPVFLHICQTNGAVNPAGGGPPGHLPRGGGGGILFPPLTFSQISSKCLGVSKQKLAHNKMHS